MAAALSPAWTVREAAVERSRVKFTFWRDATLPDVTGKVLELIAFLEKNFARGNCGKKAKVNLRLYFKISGEIISSSYLF